MKLFNASFTTIVLRFYLLMAVVIGAVLSGYTLVSILALPIFLSALLGPAFKLPKLSKGAVRTPQKTVTHAFN